MKSPTKIQDPPRSLNHRSRHVMLPGLRRAAGRLDAYLPGGGLEDGASPRLSGDMATKNMELMAFLREFL